MCIVLQGTPICITLFEETPALFMTVTNYQFHIYIEGVRENHTLNMKIEGGEQVPWETLIGISSR